MIADGELISDGAHAYTWDAAHRLVEVANIEEGGIHVLAAKYTYDGLGRRITITGPSPSDVRYYLWCGETLCQAHDSDNNVTAKYFAQGEWQTAGSFFTPATAWVR